jgi:hypothetical protein
MNFCSVDFVMFSSVYGLEFKQCQSPQLLIFNLTEQNSIKITYHTKNTVLFLFSKIYIMNCFTQSQNGLIFCRY